MQALLFLLPIILQPVLAQVSGTGATITWHPHGCGSSDDTMRLQNPADSGSSDCVNNDANGFPPTNTPAGGWEIQNLPALDTFEVRQGPQGLDVCGTEVVLSVTDSGCYDLPSLANEAWWDFCRGSTCGASRGSATMAMRRRKSKQIASATALNARVMNKKPGVVYKDGMGEYMVTPRGTRVPVYRQNGTSPATKPRHKRHVRRSADATYSPPSDCFIDSFSCQSLAGDGSLIATCENCADGFAAGTMASASRDCRNEGSDCTVELDSSMTVTDTISEDITFGASIASTGKDGGSSGTASFGLSESFSVSTTAGQSETFTIPAGKIGFVQYQAPAVVGTVVTSQVGSQFCDGIAEHKICGAADGVLATSSDDSMGQYSVVLTS